MKAEERSVFSRRINELSDHFIQDKYESNLQTRPDRHLLRSSIERTLRYRIVSSWRLLKNPGAFGAIGHYLLTNVNNYLQSPESKYEVITCDEKALEPLISLGIVKGEMHESLPTLHRVSGNVAGFHVIAMPYMIQCTPPGYDSNGGKLPGNGTNPFVNKALHICGIVNVFSNDLIQNPQATATETGDTLPMPYGESKSLYEGRGYDFTWESKLNDMALNSSQKIIDSIALPRGAVTAIGGPPGCGKTTLQQMLVLSPAFKTKKQLRKIKRVVVKATETGREDEQLLQKYWDEDIDFYDFAIISVAQIQMIMSFYKTLGYEIWMFLDSMSGASALKPFPSFSEQVRETGWSTNTTHNMKMLSSLVGPHASLTITFPFDGKKWESILGIWSFYNASFNLSFFLSKDGHLKDLRYASRKIGPFLSPAIEEEGRGSETGEGTESVSKNLPKKGVVPKEPKEDPFEGYDEDN